MIRIEAEFPALTESSTVARRMVASTLEEWGRADLVDRAQLLVSELVSNAVQHGHSSVTLCMSLDGDVLKVEISDSSSTPPRRRSPLPDEPAGRGLAIVESLSDAWGVESTSTGKVVWFEVASGP